ncbi:hypothetical protein [Amantichitinum ursilacus]|uniref:Glycosyltransferase RgtA/B/C/D-like domain-containing protein n=1 Tax=Amantichitinum ursilacus TaxID=857265 RepID=A0A0N0XGT4_9NEIS|nr:hypothetical protein [Amantichitinum ursilacus]KPC50400.1 hypothetical protein WG78_17370 [Amantichitinum ursilacus]
MTSTTSNSSLPSQPERAPAAWFSGRLACRPALLLGLVVVALLFALSLVLRAGDFRDDAIEQNMETSLHVLQTVHSLNALPISQSFMLPSVTLGNPGDKGISWGATLPTKAGVYIYTSFGPIGFVMPWLFFKLTGLAPTAHNLLFFNATLGFASALLLFAVLFRMLTLTGYGNRTALFCGVLGASLLIFSREGLHTFGMAYWNQSIEQIWLLAQLLILLAIAARPSPRLLAGLAVVSFLSASTEWSGIVGNVLMAAYFWVQARRTPIAAVGPRPYSLPARLPHILFGATVVAFGVQLLHLFIALGISPALHALLGRFIARGATSARADLGMLISGYADSYGLYLVVAALALGVLAFWPRREQRPDIPAMLLLLAVFPLLENLVMLQHAVMYTYDRMKLVTALALVIALVLARLIQYRARWPLALLSALVVLGAAQNLRQFNKLKAPMAAWPQVAQANAQLKQQIAQAVPLDCAVLGTNNRVRGYLNMLFDRSIYENQPSADAFFQTAAGVKNCGAVFIQSSMDFTDLNTLNYALVKGPDGNVTKLTARRPDLR